MSLLTRNRGRARTDRSRTSTDVAVPAPLDTSHPQPGCSPIGDARFRHTVKVSGRVRSVRIQPWADVPTLECTLVDSSGGITVVFLGRRHVAGVHPGTVMRIEGVAGAHAGKLAVLNPEYALLDQSEIAPGEHG